MKKITGWIMIIVVATIIIYNVNESKENDRKFANDPFGTLLSGGKNLSDAYSFTQPYSEFEVVVMAAGLIGLVPVFAAKGKK